MFILADEIVVPKVWVLVDAFHQPLPSCVGDFEIAEFELFANFVIADSVANHASSPDSVIVVFIVVEWMVGLRRFKS